MKEERKENLMTVIIIILVFVILAMGVYIIYTLPINEQEKKDNLISNNMIKEENIIENKKVINSENKVNNTTNVSNESNIKNENSVTNVSNKKTVNVIFEKKQEDNGYKLVFKGKDSNNKIIWTYETITGPLTELETVEKLEIKDDKIYINEAGTITVLEKESGKVLWKNSEYKGASSAFCFDNKGNLYIAGYYGPALCVINKNGKTLKRIESFGEEYIWPSELNLRNDDKELIIICTIANKEDAVLVVNLENYTTKIEEN